LVVCKTTGLSQQSSVLISVLVLGTNAQNHQFCCINYCSGRRDGRMIWVHLKNGVGCWRKCCCFVWISVIRNWITEELFTCCRQSSGSRQQNWHGWHQQLHIWWYIEFCLWRYEMWFRLSYP